MYRTHLLVVASFATLLSSLHPAPSSQGGVTPGDRYCKGSVTGYVGGTYDDPDDMPVAGAVLNCEPQCSPGCMVVTVPDGFYGEAMVCSCATGDPNPCCTIGIDVGNANVVAVGGCDWSNCPGDTECHLTITYGAWFDPPRPDLLKAKCL